MIYLATFCCNKNNGLTFSKLSDAELHVHDVYRIKQRTLTVGVMEGTIQLVSSLTGLDLTEQENMLLFACSDTSEVTESTQVKLETFPLRILAHFQCDQIWRNFDKMSTKVFSNCFRV